MPGGRPATGAVGAADVSPSSVPWEQASTWDAFFVEIFCFLPTQQIIACHFGVFSPIIVGNSPEKEGAGMVGKNIKKFRTAKQMTQDELAQKLNVTRQAVSNWENGVSQTKGY